GEPAGHERDEPGRVGGVGIHERLPRRGARHIHLSADGLGRALDPERSYGSHALPLLGSNQDSPDPKSGVLPITPRGSVDRTLPAPSLPVNRRAAAERAAAVPSAGRWRPAASGHL